MMRHLITLTVNDLAVAFRNKAVYLMAFVPLFVFLSLSVVDRPDAPLPAARLGLVRGGAYAAGLAPSVEAARSLFTVTWLTSEAEARRQVKAAALDGALLPGGDAAAAMLLVAKKASPRTLAMASGLTQLQRTAEGQRRPDWVGGVTALDAGTSMELQTLPVWILMMILLVGCLILPPQVAEEKEKKLVLGLLQTPVRESVWLLAKVLTGMVLALLAIGLLHALGRFAVGQAGSYVAFLLAGTFCFSAMGLLLGFLCRSQASARALGVVCYLPLLLPSALGDYSHRLDKVAPFVPSYQLFAPVRAILLDGATAEHYLPQLACLVLAGALCYVASVALLRRRWLL